MFFSSSSINEISRSRGGVRATTNKSPHEYIACHKCSCQVRSYILTREASSCHNQPHISLSKEEKKNRKCSCTLQNLWHQLMQQVW